MEPRQVAKFLELRLRLKNAEAERDAARAELSNARVLLGNPVGVDIAVIGLLAEVAKFKQENCDLLIGHAELTRQLTRAQKEEIALQNDIGVVTRENARLRFYIAELEAAARSIDMHLAHNAAEEKFRAAFGEE